MNNVPKSDFTPIAITMKKTINDKNYQLKVMVDSEIDEDTIIRTMLDMFNAIKNCKEATGHKLETQKLEVDGKEIPVVR